MADARNCCATSMVRGRCDHRSTLQECKRRAARADCHRHLMRKPCSRREACLSPVSRTHLFAQLRKFHAHCNFAARDRYRQRLHDRRRGVRGPRRVSDGADRVVRRIASGAWAERPRSRAPSVRNDKRAMFSALALGDQSGSHRSRVGFCGRASRLRRTSPAAGMGGTSNPPSLHRAPA